MNYNILFLFILFSNVFENNIEGFRYWDEITTMIVLCIGVVYLARSTRLNKQQVINWLLLIILLVLGILGNIYHPGYQSNKTAVFRDIIAVSKFFIIVFICKNRRCSSEKQNRIIRNAAICSKIIIIITACCAVYGYFFKTPFYTGEVRMVKCFTFVFSHPTFYVGAYVIILSILIAESIRKNTWFILIDCGLIFMAQRTKGMIIIAITLIILLLGEKRCSKIYAKIMGIGKKKTSHTRLYILIAVMVAIAWLLAKEKVMMYLQWGMSAARPAMYIVGFRIMMDFFPLGSGFGTFASSLSGRYYSKIYSAYKISYVSGIQKNSYSYIGDVFWPYIYGQFGVFGAVIYIMMLIRVLGQQIKSDMSFSSRMAVLVLWFYALTASTAEAFFTNATGVQMALILSIFIGYTGNKGEMN